MEREEAIEAIKAKMDYYESDKRLRAALETLIPELAESEDERIRKIIIKHFEEIANRNEQSWINLDIPYILAYLEKQKEHAEDLETEIDLYSEEHFEYNSEYDTLSPKGGFYFSPRTLSDIARHFYSLGRKYGGEQDGMITVSKEAWDENAKDSFERGIKVGRIRQQKEQKPHRVAVDTCEAIDKVREFDEQMGKEQKPVDWSEEDENKIESIKGLITTGRFADTNTIRTIWELLDSLRPSWKPIEEDIKMLEHIIGQYETWNKNSKVMGYLPRVEELSFLKKVLSKWKN